MHRGLPTYLSLTGMLLFLLISLSSYQPIDGVTIYYDAKGKAIYSKPSVTSKSYVIKTFKRLNKIFPKQERSTSVPIAEIRCIKRKIAMEVKRLIIKGKVDDKLVVDNTIEILDPSILRSMRGMIEDNGMGGDIVPNNKEYGGLVSDTDSIFNVLSGKHKKPCDSGKVVIRLPQLGKAEFHSHPSGCQGLIKKWPCPDSEAASKPGPCGLTQGPSQEDQLALGKGRMGYVFGMRARLVFIYDSTGVQATLPFTFFERGSYR